jgi:LysM repeat protein
MPPQKSQVAAKMKSPPAPAPIETQAEYYTMKVGDNPWSIAMKHHIKVDELLKMNGLNEKTARKLKPGDRLKIR